MAEEYIVKLEGLNFSYADQEKQALRDINLELKKGESGALMGHSGAGKSTLIKTLNGVIPHLVRGKLTGDATVAGSKPGKVPTNEMARSVGIVFQDFETQLFSTSVLLEVAFGPENFGVSRDEIQRRIIRYMEAVRLTGFDKRQPAMLSGGQKQRLAIASVLAIEPQLICFDEPTTDLDPIGKSEIFKIMRELREKTETSSLVVEHETEEIIDTDRAWLMKEGEIVKAGPTRTVLADVEAFRNCGVMPIQTADLFHRLEYPDRPLIVSEAVETIKRLDLSVSEQAYQEIVAKDAYPGNTQDRETIIDVNNISFSYPNGFQALKGVSLKIAKGEFVAILGQNGGGKTTLMKQFNGLLRPTEGKVIVAGLDTARHNIAELGRKVQYVFQNPDHQIFAQTIAEEIGFGPKLMGLDEKEVARRVESALAAVQLSGFENEDPFSLTKDGRQAVAVASVLATQSEVIILDEPTTGLDARQLQHMMELVTSLNKMGHTVIIVTHSMSTAVQYSPRTVVVSDGKIALDGPTRQVFSHEDTLRKLFLKPPQIVSLGNALGHTTLSVDEMVRCLGNQTVNKG